jgi:hypothetical protein
LQQLADRTRSTPAPTMMIVAVRALRLTLLLETPDTDDAVLLAWQNCSSTALPASLWRSFRWYL